MVYLLPHSWAFISKDCLSLYFMFLILLISIPIFIYSKGYTEEYRKYYSVKYFWMMMIIFVLSMMGVVLSNNSIVFMVFWELMSVSSFFLVIYEYRKKESLKSGVMYFIMTHISGLLLMLMYTLIAKYTGSMNFSDIAKHSINFSISQRYIILILAILGFGAKSGIIPLHPWLPKAHPAAPSNISALMSGVMLKIALYGFIRISFLFIGNIPLTYGIFVMFIGAGTAVYSILNALFQDDIKKLLAYSSSENIGIIFSTLGLSMIFNYYNLHTLGNLALTAALFHILNHAIFKSLLFTSAGSVIYATGTRSMNELGGLHSKIKFTALCAFLGTAAICAIPPFNGFASEILILKSFIEAGIAIKNPELVFIIFLSGVILVITSGLVVWSGVKSFGMTFLGAPRSNKAELVHKIPNSMNAGMAVLSFYAVIFGVLSPLAIKYISRFSMSITGFGGNIFGYTFGYEIIFVTLIMTVVTGIIYIITRSKSGNEKVEVGDTWGCGFNDFKPYMQYSGNGFSQPATRVAGCIAGYQKETRVKNTIHLRQRFMDIIEVYLYSNIIKLIDFVASKLIKIHYGKIQAYISYIFISLIIAVILVAKFV